MQVVPNISLRELSTLEAVAQAGSFAAAARRQGTTRIDVSRTIARLEQQLGVRLFLRTTRSVTPTDATRELVGRMRPALTEIAVALGRASETREQFRGPLRITCSEAFGRHFLLAPLSSFLASHPAVALSLQLTDTIDDLSQTPIDLAIRLGPLPSSSLIATRLGRLEVCCVASPKLNYAARQSLESVARRPTIGFRIPGTAGLYSWRVWLGEHSRTIPNERVAVETDSIEAVAGFARLGYGLAVVPHYLVADDLQAGRLVEITIAGGRLEGPEAHLCYVSRELMPARVRELCDMLIEALRAQLKG